MAFASVALCIAAWAPPSGDLLLSLDADQAGTLSLDGAFVESWRDERGAGLALAAEGDRRPLLVRREGLPAVVRFDGVDDVLGCAGAAIGCETWTLAMVVAPLSNRGGQGGLLSGNPRGGMDYDPGLTVDLRNSGMRLEELNVEGAGRIGATMDLLCRDYPFGELRLVVVERGRDEVRLTVDGLREATRPVRKALTTCDELRLGARHYAGREQGYLHADVARVLLWGRTLAPQELQALTQALLPDPVVRAREEEIRMEALRGTARSVPPEVVRSWASTAAWASDRPDDAPEVSTLPVRTDLVEAIALCMACLNASFDRDRDGEPFFYANRRADGAGEMHHSVNIGIPHVVGRALWGTMLGERTTGIPFPPDGLEILERYLRQSFANEDHLNSYFDPARDGRRFVEFHNMREGLYGLVALIEGRDSLWARDEAHRMLETLDAITDAGGRWSHDLLRARGMVERCEGVGPPNAARMVDPLLRYWRLTGDPLGWKLAAAYARAGMPELCFADGRFRPMEHSSGHVHSITSSLSGITEYAILAEDTELLAWCRRALDRGVPEFFSSWGWGDEVVPEHPANEPSRGEINQTGDVIRMALLLGDAGQTECYELAERFTRSMLLPTQHREDELRDYLHDAPDPASDAERDVLARSIGGYAMQYPNDRMKPGDWPLSTLDITSGAVHALCEVARRRCVVEGKGLRVVMPFDYEGPELAIDSGLPLEGRIDLTSRRTASVEVRLPPWVDPATVRLDVGGQQVEARVEAGFVRLGRLEAGERARVRFPVPCREERETVDGVEYHTTWIGNQVVEILPRGAVSPLPF